MLLADDATAERCWILFAHPKSISLMQPLGRSMTLFPFMSLREQQAVHIKFHGLVSALQQQGSAHFDAIQFYSMTGN